MLFGMILGYTEYLTDTNVGHKSDGQEMFPYQMMFGHEKDFGSKTLVRTSMSLPN